MAEKSDDSPLCSSRSLYSGAGQPAPVDAEELFFFYTDQERAQGDRTLEADTADGINGFTKAEDFRLLLEWRRQRHKERE